MDGVATLGARVAAMLAPGVRFADILAEEKRTYVELGYPEEWHYHFQGGITGYALADPTCCRDPEARAVARQAYDYFLTITGAKFEELMLLTIWKLRDNAYGVQIRKHVSDLTDKYWSIGAIYDVLDRLARKGFVITKTGPPTRERGGKSKRFYRVSRTGFEALEEVRELQKEMWSDLPDLVFE